MAGRRAAVRRSPAEVVDIVWNRSEFQIRASSRARVSSSSAFDFVGGVERSGASLSSLSLSHAFGRLGFWFFFLFLLLTENTSDRIKFG